VTIFNPTTGETNEKAALLSLLMEWTTDGPIMAAMVKAGRADFPGLALLGAMVRSTLDGPQGPQLVGEDGQALAEPDMDLPPPLEEPQIAAALLSFLVDMDVRKKVADYVSKTRSVSYVRAKDDLLSMRIHLGSTWGIQPEHVPTFCAGNPEVTDRLRVEAAMDKLFKAPAMEFEEAKRWLADYEADDIELDDVGRAYLHRMDPRLVDQAILFPPLCIVRAREGEVMRCPAPGYYAIVLAHEMVADQPVLVLSAWLDVEAPRAQALPVQLVRVACRGRITGEAVTEVLRRDCCSDCGAEFGEEGHYECPAAVS
jgi:hypothetical protein